MSTRLIIPDGYEIADDSETIAPGYLVNDRFHLNESWEKTEMFGLLVSWASDLVYIKPITNRQLDLFK